MHQSSTPTRPTTMGVSVHSRRLWYAARPPRGRLLGPGTGEAESLHSRRHCLSRLRRPKREVPRSLPPPATLPTAVVRTSLAGDLMGCWGLSPATQTGPSWPPSRRGKGVAASSSAGISFAESPAASRPLDGPQIEFSRGLARPWGVAAARRLEGARSSTRGSSPVRYHRLVMPVRGAVLDLYETWYKVPYRPGRHDVRRPVRRAVWRQARRYTRRGRRCHAGGMRGLGGGAPRGDHGRH